MASALNSALLAAAASLACLPAFAGSAPAAYYPSLGYGQTPPAYVGEPAYYDAPYASVGEPAYFDPRDHSGPAGPPPGYVGDPAYYDPPPPTAGEPAYGGSEDYPPPGAYRHHGGGAWSGHGSSYSSQSYGASAGRSVEEYGYDSGWREQGSASGGSYRSGGYGSEERSNGEHAYVGGSVSEYDYDSGWRERGGSAPLQCPFAHPHGMEGPPPPPHPICPSVYDHHRPYVERLPNSFFADSGGVGPDYVAGGGGGGGVIFEGGGGSAFASARASARVSVGVRVRGHGGGHGMRHGCGCGGHR